MYPRTAVQKHGQVQGRTLRQEREKLGLLGTDPTLNKVVVVSKRGILQARWDYKFPYTANDGVLVIVCPLHLPIIHVAVQAVERFLRESPLHLHPKDEGLPCHMGEHPSRMPPQRPGFGHLPNQQGVEFSVDSSMHQVPNLRP